MKNTRTDDTFSTRGPLIVLILSLSVIFSAIVSSYFRYDKTLDDYQLVNETNRVKLELITLKNALFENSIRTYLITGDKKYKVDLEPGFNACLKQLQKVKSMTRDDLIQQQRCDSINQIIQFRQLLLERLVEEKEAGNDSLVYKDAIEARNVSDQLITVVNRMNDVESGLLGSRTEIAESGGRISAIFLIVASAISFFFIILTYLMLVRAYKKGLVLQAELSQNVKDLNRSNSELEQFAYVASHDLQEPLRKLRTFSNMLQIKEKGRLSDEGNELLDRMQSFGARMQRLIEDLLTFSRMVSKEAEMVPINLDKLITDIKNGLPDTQKGKNIFIHFSDLPVVNGYESQLVQLFQNLISNSIKYSKAGEDVKIDISASGINGSLPANVSEKDKKVIFHKVTLTDNGIGFDNQYSEKIFNIFQRLHGKTEYEGTGIGLAICKRVVENHGGYIEALSHPGVGTTINVYLPKN